MKRLFLVFILLLMSLLVGASPTLAAGTLSTHLYRQTASMMVLEVDWTADSSDGSFSAVSIDGMAHYLGWYLSHVMTKPGSTAPTANYDIVIGMNGISDIMGGALADRSATATELVEIAATSSSFVPVAWPLTMTITNNSVNSATGIVYLVFVHSNRGK